MENTHFGFEIALNLLQQGKKVARSGWNGKGMHVAIQNPDLHSANSRPYVYIISVDGGRVPWVASQSDLLSHDWYVVGNDRVGAETEPVSASRAGGTCAQAPTTSLVDKIKEIRSLALSWETAILSLKQHPDLQKNISNDALKKIIEAGENIKLAHRHVEDARMRLGKVIQAMEDGVSIYDRKEDQCHDRGVTLGKNYKVI